MLVDLEIPDKSLDEPEPADPLPRAPRSPVLPDAEDTVDSATASP